MLLDIQKPDFRRCDTCCQWVPLEPYGMKCLCELTRDNHLAAVIDARRLTVAPEPYPLYIARIERGMLDSDTQDAPTSMPSYGINWRSTLTICAICLFLAALFVHAGDGMYKSSQSHSRAVVEADAQVRSQDNMRERLAGRP